MTRRDTIIMTVEDLVSDLMHYDRDNDEELPEGAIEEAIAAGEITVEEIIVVFESGLRDVIG